TASVSSRVMSPRTSSSSAPAIVRPATASARLGRRGRLHRARRLGGPGVGRRGFRGRRRLFFFLARRAGKRTGAKGRRGRDTAAVVEAVVVVAQLGRGALVLFARIGLLRLDRRG